MHKLEWDFKNSRLEPDAISKFSKEFKIGYVFATILLNRGIKTEEDLKKYISKSLEFVHNPNLLPDIDKAARRIIKAINEKEKIVPTRGRGRRYYLLLNNSFIWRSFASHQARC